MTDWKQRIRDILDKQPAQQSWMDYVRRNDPPLHWEEVIGAWTEIELTAGDIDAFLLEISNLIEGGQGEVA